jgi:serine/threonine protein kinase
VEEGSTSLKTLIGTKGYLAPEINGLYPKKDGLAEQIEKKPYTSAVDIWALGEICFKLITNRPAFPTTGELVEYVVLGHDFPRASLLEANASTDCVNFIEMMMSAEAATRPSASDGLMCGWMKTTGKTRSGSQPRLKKQYVL